MKANVTVFAQGTFLSKWSHKANRILLILFTLTVGLCAPLCAVKRAEALSEGHLWHQLLPLSQHL